MKVVKFKVSCPPYSSGEIASFDDNMALKLQMIGVADIMETNNTNLNRAISKTSRKVTRGAGNRNSRK